MDRLIQANVKGEKSILLSEHKQDKDILLANTIDIEIVNVSCAASAMFFNNLPADAPIPGINVEQDQVSVIYIYFPLGDGDAYLTTNVWAEKMHCYAPYNWGVEKAHDQLCGVYFKLYPLSDYDLAPREKMYVSISNLVSFGQLEKMVYAAVRFTNIPMSDQAVQQAGTVLLEEALDTALNAALADDLAGTDFLAYFKKRSPLNILSFACSRTKVAIGDTVQLDWAIVGDAVKCVLTPGDFVVESVGSMEVEVSRDTTFRLHAFGANEQISRTATVYADSPIITKFTADCVDQKTKFGQPVTLSYEVKDGYSIYLNQGIGRVSGNAIAVVPAKASTTYTLSCMGTEGLVQKSLTITVTDFLKVQLLSFTRSDKSDGSYTYYLKWAVANCIDINLTTSDGQVRSSGQASGATQFSTMSAEELTVQLYCTGTAGQVIKQTYSV